VLRVSEDGEDIQPDTHVDAVEEDATGLGGRYPDTSTIQVLAVQARLSIRSPGLRLFGGYKKYMKHDLKDSFRRTLPSLLFDEFLGLTGKWIIWTSGGVYGMSGYADHNTAASFARLMDIGEDYMICHVDAEANSITPLELLSGAALDEPTDIPNN